MGDDECGAVGGMRMEGLCQLKNLMISSGIEPATFLLAS
jgi:hypothetical protein